MKIAYSRAIVNAALDGALGAGDFVKDPIFGLHIPTACPGVPDDILNPRNAWADKEAYDAAAGKLVEMFRANFGQFARDVSPEVAAVL